MAKNLSQKQFEMVLVRYGIYDQRTFDWKGKILEDKDKFPYLRSCGVDFFDIVGMEGKLTKYKDMAPYFGTSVSSYVKRCEFRIR